MVQENAFDGVDISEQNVGDNYDKARITRIVRAAREALKKEDKHYEVSFARRVSAFNDNC